MPATDGSDDVVVDNVSFGQWCASSYNDMDSSGRFVNEDFKDKTPGFACPTNWVYMNGWVTVESDFGSDAEHAFALKGFIDGGPVRTVR